MKRNLLFLAATLLAGAIVAACTAMTAKKPGANTNKQRNTVTPDRVVAFSYERHDNPAVWSQSCVYRLSCTEAGQAPSFYYRHRGTTMGWYFSRVEGADTLLRELEAAARAHGLDKMSQTPLSEEDRGRARWMVEITYSSGKKISVVEYLPQNDKTVFRKTAEGMFDSLILKIERGECEHGEYTETTYNAHGHKSREIHHLPDGTVHSGRDYDTPDVDF